VTVVVASLESPARLAGRFAALYGVASLAGVVTWTTGPVVS